MKLAQLLRRELQTTSLRNLQAKTGLSHSLLRKLARGNTQEPPELRTLQKLARAFRLPLWCVLEMAGIELEQPCNQSAFAFYAAEQIADNPLLQQLYERLLTASDDELSRLLAYISKRSADQFSVYWDTESDFDEEDASPFGGW